MIQYFNSMLASTDHYYMCTVYVFQWHVYMYITSVLNTVKAGVNIAVTWLKIKAAINGWVLGVFLCGGNWKVVFMLQFGH